MRILLLLSLPFFTGTCFANDLSDCKVVVGPNTVRYNYGYTFYNVFEVSASESPVYLNRWRVDYINPEYLDKPRPQGEKDFDFTKSIRDKEFNVNPGESIRHLESLGKFRIAKRPVENRDYDFAIKYTTYYDFTNMPLLSVLDRSHTSCGTYKVSYCGDGIVDNKYNEECDDKNDVNGDGCSSTCNIEPK